MSYPTIYGPVKVSLGHSFSIVQPAAGLNFVLPAPKATGGASDFDAAKMAGWLASYQLGTGADSYGGQTTLSQAAQLTLMAQQLGDPNYNRLLGILRSGVTNWLTYQAGDTKFYTAYPKDGGLIAYPPAFGSDHYTDLHFHLGYLTSSAAVLAMLDPTWATNYGGIATLVAKSYANWDRSDTSEPYLRTFNPWKGHSYADGLGDSLGNQGNNQESASEAVQSWQGLVLLGQALGNQQMTDAGMMGYVMETKAEMEYWLNVAHQDLNPPGFPANRNTAINADFTREAQTFFGTNPKYELGIEGLPDWPSMDFLGKYNPAMQAEIDATLAAISTTDPYGVLGSTDDGNNWLSVILGIQGQVNPQKAADQFARLPSLNAADNTSAITGIPYYNTYANRTIGLRDFAFHLSVPVGGVYTNSASGKRTYVAYNATNATQTVQVFDAAGNVVDSFSAAPRTVTTIAPFATLRRWRAHAQRNACRRQLHARPDRFDDHRHARRQQPDVQCCPGQFRRSQRARRGRPARHRLGCLHVQRPMRRERRIASRLRSRPALRSRSTRASIWPTLPSAAPANLSPGAAQTLSTNALSFSGSGRLDLAGPRARVELQRRVASGIAAGGARCRLCERHVERQRDLQFDGGGHRRPYARLRGDERVVRQLPNHVRRRIDRRHEPARSLHHRRRHEPGRQRDVSPTCSRWRSNTAKPVDRSIKAT